MESSYHVYLTEKFPLVTRTALIVIPYQQRSLSIKRSACHEGTCSKRLRLENRTCQIELCQSPNSIFAAESHQTLASGHFPLVQTYSPFFSTDLLQPRRSTISTNGLSTQRHEAIDCKVQPGDGSRGICISWRSAVDHCGSTWEKRTSLANETSTIYRSVETYLQSGLKVLS